MTCRRNCNCRRYILGELYYENRMHLKTILSMEALSQTQQKNKILKKKIVFGVEYQKSLHPPQITKLSQIHQGMMYSKMPNLVVCNSMKMKYPIRKVYSPPGQIYFWCTSFDIKMGSGKNKKLAIKKKKVHICEVYLCVRTCERRAACSWILWRDSGPKLLAVCQQDMLVFNRIINLFS